ncbi:Uncharacterised protein [uncultured archaeon]|nr:Uncharacterised protein [uncultured archaeon]
MGASDRVVASVTFQSLAYNEVPFRSTALKEEWIAPDASIFFICIEYEYDALPSLSKRTLVQLTGSVISGEELSSINAVLITCSYFWFSDWNGTSVGFRLTIRRYAATARSSSNNAAIPIFRVSMIRLTIF